MLKRARLIAVILSVISGTILSLPLPVSASVYGRGDYSKCKYQTDCPTVTPSDTSGSNADGDAGGTPATPETPAQPNTTVIIKIPSLVNNSVVETKQVPIGVIIQKQLDDGTFETIDPANISKVIFYVNNRAVDTQYVPGDDGQYHFNWDVLKNPGTLLDFVAYDKQGNLLQRKTLVVTFSSKIAALVANAANKAADSGNKRHINGPLRTILQNFPYWLLLVLLLVALRLWWQSIREARALNALRALLAQEREIATLKQNFMSLVSHYLRTPVTSLAGGVELISPQVRLASAQQVSLLEAAVQSMQSTTESVITILDGSKTMQNIPSVGSVPNLKPAYRSAQFWLPVVSILLLSIIAQTLTSLATTIHFTLYDILTEVVIGTAIITFFLLGIRQRQLQRSQRATEQQLLSYEQSLDASRNTFLEQAATQLGAPLTQLEQTVKGMNLDTAAKFINGSITKLHSLVLQLKIAAAATSDAIVGGNNEAVGMRSLAQDSLDSAQQTIEKKQLSIQLPPSDSLIVTNKRLARYVVDAILNNAVTFAADKTAIKLTLDSSNTTLTMSVTDHGAVIPTDKLTTIFTPFGRATSIEEFNYEGIGLSLYICKLLIARLGGTITATSDETAGTTFTVTLPVARA